MHSGIMEIVLAEIVPTYLSVSVAFTDMKSNYIIHESIN